MFTDNFTKYSFPNIGFIRLPQVTISIEEKQKAGAPIDCDNYTYLTYLCLKGFEERLLQGKIPKNETKEYTKRCQEELEIFKKNGLVDYFLLIYDILNWCDKNKIARGIARGSSSGSLCLFLLKITNINPITHNLFFTRFINESRLQAKTVDGILYVSGSTLCDVDSDVSYRHRGRVLEYIEQKYKGKVSKIGTQICLTGKVLIKECTKVFLDYSESESQYLSSFIERVFGTVDSLEDALEKSKDFKEWVKDSKHQECFDIARKLENLIKAKGMHPSGIGISFENIEDIAPVELSPKKEVITAYSMQDVANLMVKIDILGLKNADINFEVCKMVGIDINSININDPSIYNYLQTKNTYHGLFQIECGLGKNTVMSVKPQNIDHLSTSISAGRPGSMSSIPKYIEYLHKGTFDKIHPEFDKILKDTANLIIFQEQINEICQKVYKLSGIDADNIRYAIGKKKRDIMQKWEPILYQKGKENNIPEEITKQFWDTCNKSTDYLFCKGHGYSYGYMAAINTYLKVNYSKEFYLALLQMAKHEPNYTDVLSIIWSELNSIGLKLLPPHITKSKVDFQIDGDSIRFGLGSIKGISEKAIAKLENFKIDNCNKFELFRAANEAGVASNIIFSLIFVGSIDDCIQESRSKTYLEFVLWNLLKEKEKNSALLYGPEFEFRLLDLVKALNTTKKDDKGKPLIKDSRMATLRKHFNPHQEIYRHNLKHAEFSTYYFERALLGFSYSTNLINIFKSACPELVSIEKASNMDEGYRVQIVGEVVESKQGKSKEKKTPYLKTIIKDHTGFITTLMFDTEREQNIEQCLEDNGKLSEEGDIVICRGQKKGDCLFLKTLSIQDTKVFMKISEFKNSKKASEEDNK